MAENEFATILRLVARIVHWLSEAAVDLVLCMLIVVPLLLPWWTLSVIRLPWRLEFNRERIREAAVLHVLAAIGDLILMPFGVIALLNPISLPALVDAACRRKRRHLDDEAMIDYDSESRCFLMAQCLIGVAGLFCFIFGLFAFLHPWRTWDVASASLRILRRHEPVLDDGHFESYIPVQLGLCWLWTSSACGVLLDWPCFLLGLLSLLCPTRCVPLLREVFRASECGPWPEVALGVHVFPWGDLRLLCLAGAATAFVDLVTLPFLVLALLMPTRTSMTTAALWQGVGAPAGSPEDAVERILDSYDFELRFVVAHQAVLGLIDLPCLILGLVAAVHPWRTLEIMRAILLRCRGGFPTETVPPERVKDWLGEWNYASRQMTLCFIRSFGGVLVDWAALLSGLLALVCPTRTLPFLREAWALCSEDRRRSPAAEWTQWWDEVNRFAWERLWGLCFANLAYAFLELLTLPFFLLALFSMIRTAPTVAEVRRHSRGLAPQIEVSKHWFGADVNFPNGRYNLRRKTLKGGPCYKHAYGEDGLIGFWEGAWHFVVSTSEVLRFVPFAKSPHAAEVGADGAAWEQGIWQKNVHGLGGAWVGEPLPAFNAQAVVWRDDPLRLTLGGMSYSIRARLDVARQGCLVAVDIFFLPFFLLSVLSVYRAWPVLESMRRDAAVDLRGAALCGAAAEAAAPKADIECGCVSTSQPAAMVVGKASPAAEGAGFAQPANTEAQKTGSGCSLAFGWGARREAVLQTLLICLDILALPCLLVCAISGYRLNSLRGLFGYHSLRFHRGCIFNAAVVLIDLALLLPAIFVLLGVYRVPFVVAKSAARAPTEPSDGSWYKSEPASKTVTSEAASSFSVDWRLRLEVLRQAGLQVADIVVAVPLSVVLASWYRWKRCRDAFTATGLAFHCEVLLGFVIVLHDVLLACTLGLLLLITGYRLRFVARAASSAERDTTPPEEAQSPGEVAEDTFSRETQIRVATYLQGALLLCDLIVALPLLLVTMTGYRWWYIKGTFKPKGVKFHARVLVSSAVVLHDALVLLILGPPLLVTLYRLPHVARAAAAASDAASDTMEAKQARVRKAFYSNSGVILLDVAMFAPCLLLLITWYRSRAVRELFCSRRGHAAAGSEADSLEGRSQANDIDAQLAAADPSWGTLIGQRLANEAASGSALAPPASRLDCWVEFFHLLMDGLFLPFALFVMLTGWRAPQLTRRLFGTSTADTNCSRRLAVALEAALTLRDLLLLPIFLLLLVTPRSFALVSKLCARRKVPLRGECYLAVKHVDVTVPEEGNITLSVQAQAAQPLGCLTAGSLRLQVVGQGFWKAVERRFGATIAGVGQSLLPLKLRPLDTDAYTALGEAVRSTSDKVTLSITLPQKLKRKVIVAKARELGLDVGLLIQLEGSMTSHDTRRASPTLLCAVAITLGQVVECAEADAGSKRLTTDDLGDDRLVEQCRGVEHQGMVESFWLLTALEGAQLLLDAAHFLLFLFTLAAPWRFVKLIKLLCEPKARWPCRNCDDALAVMRRAECIFRELRGELLPLCNTVAKDPEAARNWCGGLRRAPSKILQHRPERLGEQGQLASRLRSSLKFIASEDVTKGVGKWLDLQDTSLYYTALRCYINCSLVAGQVSIEEHGLLIDRVQQAEASLVAAAEAERAKVEVEAASSWEVAKRGKSKWGFWRKDVKVMRKMIRATAAGVVIDYVGLAMVLVVVVTVYGIPRLLCDLHRHRVFSVTDVMFRVLLERHLRAAAREKMLFLQVILLWMLVLVTLVRFPEALKEAASARHSLESMRDMLLLQLEDAFCALCDLLNVFTYLKTYKLIIKAAAQCCLVPPACLSELIGKVCRCLPLCLRFLASFIVFYALALAPIGLSLLDAPNVSAERVRQGLLAAVGICLLCNLASVFRTEKFYAMESDDWLPPTMRATWCNFLSICAVVGQPSLLCVILVRRYSPEIAPWMPTISGELSEQLAWASLGLASLWLLLVSLMFITGQSEEFRLLQRNPFFRGLQLLLAQVLFLPTVLGLLAPMLSRQLEATLPYISLQEGAWLFALCVYLVTTQMLSNDAGILDSMPMDCGIDVRYPALYLMGAQVADLLIVIAPLVLAWQTERRQLMACAVFAFASLVWVVGYRCLLRRGCAPCCVPHVAALRAGGSIAVCWTSVFLLLQDAGCALHAVWLTGGVAGCAAVSVGVAALARRGARKQQQSMLEASGFRRAVEVMAGAAEEMCVRDAVAGGFSESLRSQQWRVELESALTARALGQRLLTFETHILAERLSNDFLADRASWRASCAKANTFAELTTLAMQLGHSLRSPSTLPVLLNICSALLRRKDLAPQLVECLLGHERLNAVFDAALLAQASTASAARSRGRGCLAGCCCKSKPGAAVDMEVHCNNAAKAVEEALATFRHQHESAVRFRRKYPSSVRGDKLQAPLYEASGRSFDVEPTHITLRFRVAPVPGGAAKRRSSSRTLLSTSSRSYSAGSLSEGLATGGPSSDPRLLGAQSPPASTTPISF